MRHSSQRLERKPKNNVSIRKRKEPKDIGGIEVNIDERGKSAGREDTVSLVDTDQKREREEIAARKDTENRANIRRNAERERNAA